MASRHEPLVDEPIRPLKRVEYDQLAAAGRFEDERVELLLGAVVPMSPIDMAHNEAVSWLNVQLGRQLGPRALVRVQSSFAASDVSEPEPDVAVIPDRRYWDAHPDHAYLVVEVARTSRAKDRGVKSRVYGFAHVDEYWIVDHTKGVVEVRRDRDDGEWRTITTYARGEIIGMLAFPDVRIAVSDVLPPLDDIGG
jgi:Uma2 family endonuclease